MEVLLDLRCLQDPLAARRSVALQAEAMLRLARASGVTARLTGLLDPALPQLAPDLQALLDGVRHTGYTGALARPTALVSFAPFSHDPMFTARLLHHPAVLGVAVVDTLQPMHEPERGIPGPAAWLDHHVSLRWLARNRLFLPIHAAGGAELASVLGVRPHEAVVTGLAVHDPEAAGRFWGAVMAHMPLAAPAILRGARPSLAVVLPSNEGDRAYAGALCKALGRLASVQAFGGEAQPVPPLPFMSSEHDRVLVMLDAGGAARQHLLRYGAACMGAASGAMPDGEVRAAAEPLLLHAAAAVRATGSAMLLPCGLARTWAAGALDPPARAAARARLPGAGPRSIVLAVPNAPATGDALEDIVWALDLLRGWGVDAGLHVWSAPPLPARVQALCATLGLGGRVWCAERSGATQLQAADLALDLRPGACFGAPTALVECLGAGLRCIASAPLVADAGAPGHAHAVPERLSPVLLAEAVLQALGQPDVTEAERCSYADARSMDRTAARLLEVLGLAA